MFARSLVLGTIALVATAGLSVHAQVQQRLELRDLERNPDQFALFLHGLTRFEAVDQADSDSYYQIVGIHGFPYQAWEGQNPLGGNRQMGYCPHASTLFGSWHRPYVALFEVPFSRLFFFFLTLMTLADEIDREHAGCG